jgi:hypothetical protein
LLYRDLPNSKYSQKIDDDEDDDDIEVAHRTATRSRSTRSIASGYVRAMHTVVVVLGREARPRSIVCPITSPEWQTLVRGYALPEDMFQGQLVTPKFNFADCDVDGSARCHQLDFLKYRTAAPFYRNLFIGDANFAVRAMSLARQNKPDASLAVLQKDCRRIAIAIAHSSKARFDHCVTVVNSMLQRTDDIFEPDTLDNIAIKAFWPDADVSTGGNKGQLLSGVVRRQLALYHRELVITSHNRRKTIAVDGRLDPGGLRGNKCLVYLR